MLFYYSNIDSNRKFSIEQLLRMGEDIIQTITRLKSELRDACHERDELRRDVEQLCMSQSKTPQSQKDSKIVKLFNSNGRSQQLEARLQQTTRELSFVTRELAVVKESESSLRCRLTQLEQSPSSATKTSSTTVELTPSSRMRPLSGVSGNASRPSGSCH